MSPQDKLNIQHHGTRAIQLLRQVEVHLQQSNSHGLLEQCQLVRTLEAIIEVEIASCD